MSAHRTARRFFWAWLIGAATVSVCGVVAHALLGNARSPVIGSVVAVAIVGVQLCATYGVHALVAAKIAGGAYRYALATAVLLAIGAFVLNFVALRDLVTTWAGIDPAIAWIVPCIVDLGMAGSMIALLALVNGHSAATMHGVEHHADTQPSVHNAMRAAMHPAVHTDAHLAAAQSIVERGVVRIAPERVAKVLEAHAAGTAPSTIQRTLGVGYSTVRRILAQSATQHAQGAS